jgi:4-amino-4-deoxy-L-arabinose transferase-like glycosyltransferase
MSISPPEQRLRRPDYVLLGAVCLVLFGYALLDDRELTMHEAVLPQSAREMMADHDWLIPKFGGQPWLERPPVPQWITVGIASLVGHCDSEAVVRAGPVLMGTVVVLLVAWMASLFYGRGIGLLSGVVLATMWEFCNYATDAEPDIYLCAIVTAAMALFARLELVPRADRPEGRAFLGGRPWPVLAFFVLFGMTNLAKGLVFGTLMVAVPVTGFLVWQADLRAVRRYVWLWGWLAFGVMALAWPMTMYWQYPDVLDLWKGDYVGRLGGTYSHVSEPAWYYLVTLPWVMLPWTLPALLGLGLTWRRAFRERSAPERFLWAWAVLTPVAFSIPHGKHHHYLLQCLAPWAVLAALGAVRLWQAVRAWPTWLRHPAAGALTWGLPGVVLLVVFRSRLPGPAWLFPALLVGWPAAVFGLCWSATRPDGRLALGGLLTLLVPLYCAGYSYKTHCYDRYEDDSEFVREVRTAARPGQPLLVNQDAHPLEGFWLLFYLDERAHLLHNLTFLRDERIAGPEVCVVARARDKAALAAFGTARVLLQSRHTRGETSPADRWTLFLVRLDDHLQRRPADLYISPLQVTGRAEGPYLR